MLTSALWVSFLQPQGRLVSSAARKLNYGGECQENIRYAVGCPGGDRAVTEGSGGAVLAVR